jgi:hypothetical protein
MALAVAIHEVSSTGSPVAAERRAAAGRRAVLLLLPELLRCLLLRSEVLCSELLLLLALLLPGHHGKRMIICCSCCCWPCWCSAIMRQSSAYSAALSATGTPGFGTSAAATPGRALCAKLGSCPKFAMDATMAKFAMDEEVSADSP